MGKRRDSDFRDNLPDRAEIERMGFELMKRIDLRRPPILYRYSEKKWLDRALRLGEFRLRPASDYLEQETDLGRQDNELIRVQKLPASDVTMTMVKNGEEIQPIGEVTFTSEILTDYLTLCFSQARSEWHFDEFPGSDACLIVHDVESFCERIHKAATKSMPEWSGIDGPVRYGGKSALGVAYSKPLRFFPQQEWRFSWLPPSTRNKLDAEIIEIGSIEDIAEVIDRVDFPPGVQMNHP